MKPPSPTSEDSLLSLCGVDASFFNWICFAFSEDLGCFGLHPSVPVLLEDDDASQHSSRRTGGRAEDSLSSLPYEVLCHVATFLDSLSLSQLALVSQLMRQVSSSLLQERGMVTLQWERKTDSHGGAKWRVKQAVSSGGFISY